MFTSTEHSFELVLIFQTCLPLRCCGNLPPLPPAATTLARQYLHRRRRLIDVARKTF